MLSMLIAAVALAAQLPQDLATWPALSEDDDGEYFLDPDSVERNGDVVRFRMRGLSRMTRPDGMATLVSRQAVDCARRTMTTIDGFIYDRSGTLMRSAEIPREAQVAEPIRAGSAQDRARERLCGPN